MSIDGDVTIEELESVCPECGDHLFYELKEFPTGQGNVIQKHRIVCRNGDHVEWNHGAPEMPDTTSRPL